MLEGLLVVNGCMRTPKFEEITAMYQEAAKKHNIKMEVAYNNDFTFGVAQDGFVQHPKLTSDVKFVLFLDKDIRLAKQLEKMNKRLFNSAEVIEVCDDKSATCMALQGAGIPMPKTLVAPLVYPGTYDEEDGYIPCIEAQLAYPLVLKECFGSFGEQVYKIDNREMLKAKRRQLAAVPHLYQELVTSSYGRDVRIHVVGGEVVACMLRYSETDFRANISSGGKMETFQCPESFSRLAVRVCELLGANFAGVDLLFDVNDNPVVCEVNSNAHIKNIFECTGVNVAEAIMAYIEKEMDKR